VLSVGGYISCRVEGSFLAVMTKEELPDRPYEVLSIDLPIGPAEDKFDHAIGIEMFSRLRLLTRLNLNGWGITEEELNELGSLSLEGLIIWKAKIGDEGLRHIATKWPTLKYLNVSSTEITDNGMKYLRSLDRLEHLHIDDTDITDKGIQHLTVLKGLTVLWLRETRITDEGLQHLKSLTNLTELNLSDTKVTPAGVADLQAALPNCKIILDSEDSPAEQ
jgi:hypothetical protein